MYHQELINALQNSDIEYIKDYLKTDNYLPFHALRNFDPTYEFIDFIIGANDNSMNIGTYLTLLRAKNLNKTLYLIEHLLKKSHTYALWIIKNVIRYYADQYGDEDYDEELDIWHASYYYRDTLLRVTEYVKPYVTLKQISDFANSISESHYTNSKKYMMLDAVMYFIFQIISDDVLRSTNSKVLVNIIEVAIYANTSKSLINILTGYLDDESKRRIDDYIAMNVTPLSKPNDYESLFSESV